MIASLTKKALGFVPGWAWAAAVAALVAFALWTNHQLQAERAAHAGTRADFATAQAAAASAALLASEQARQHEQELTNALNQSTETRRKLEAERRARAADARAADGRVRSAAAAYAAAAGESCATATPGPTAAEALDLLAGLLDRVASRTTALAEYADAAADDASYCRGAYDRAREALN
jgi:hypothetical protein